MPSFGIPTANSEDVWQDHHAQRKINEPNTQLLEPWAQVANHWILASLRWCEDKLGMTMTLQVFEKSLSK